MNALMTPAQTASVERALYCSKSQPQILIDLRNREYTHLWTESAEIDGVVQTMLCSATQSYVGQLDVLFHWCKSTSYKIIK